MATLDVNFPNLLDLARRLDPDGSIAAVAEILDQMNEILPEMGWMEGNLPTGNRTSIRTGIPTPTWRKIGGGTQPTKSTTAQVTHTVGMLTAISEVDKDLAELNGNTEAFRLSEDVPHIEGMEQEFAATLIYGNEGTAPEEFTGLAPHYNLKSAQSGDNIIDALGTGVDNASIWLVVWSPSTLFGIYPKGSKAGLEVFDEGLITLEDVDGAGGRMRAYRTHFSWKGGLVVKDWRFAVRIANIDKSLLTSVLASGQNLFTTGANLPNLMFQAMRLIPNLARGRPSFYMSRDVATTVAQQSTALGFHGMIQSDKISGDERFTERFHGIPIRRVDVLAADEAQVV